MPGTRSSEVGRGPLPGVGRGLLWFVVVVNAIIGLVAVVVAVWVLLAPAGDRPWSVGTGVLVLLGGLGWLGVLTFGFYRNYLHQPPATGRRVALAEVDGERAVVLPWRTTFLHAPLWTSVFVAIVFGGGAIAFRNQGNAGWWILAIVAVPVVLVLPDKLIQLTRTCRVVMSPRGIGINGWDGDAWLDWDDVQGIAFDQVNQWTVLRVVGRDGAASWRFRRRPKVLNAITPKGPWVDIPGPALEVEVSTLFDAIAHYTRHPSARAELATETGRRRVVGTT